MKRMILERLLDVVKWSLIILIGATIFYIAGPKYQLVSGPQGLPVKINTVTGNIDAGF